MIDIFCDVIDNYGDAGVCLRLGRDITRKNIAVRLFCNNVNVLKKLINTCETKNHLIKILDWPNNNYIPSETIIQAFSVRLEKNLLEKISKKKSLVINLEYLTAEKFAEDCHKLPSYSDNIESFFFFPGFTDKTGGVVIEDSFLDKRNKIVSNSKNISVFCYENSRLKDLINNLKNSPYEIRMNIFEGKALDTFNSQFKKELNLSKTEKIGNLNIVPTAMVSQNKYDEILINSYINVVRGEDSIVRAMLCGQPFLWNIYPQEENAHLDKINALFNLMHNICSNKKTVETIRNLTLSFNNFSDYLSDFDIFNFYDEWKKTTTEWSDYIISLGSLTDHLIEFIKQKK